MLQKSLKTTTIDQAFQFKLFLETFTCHSRYAKEVSTVSIVN